MPQPSKMEPANHFANGSFSGHCPRSGSAIAGATQLRHTAAPFSPDVRKSEDQARVLTTTAPRLVSPNGGPLQGSRRSNRCVKRSRILAFEFAEQLHAASALFGNTGPHRSVSLETWSGLFGRAVEGVAKARRLLKQDTTICDSLRRAWVAKPPSWLSQLARASSLREETQRSKSILERVVEPVRRLVRHLRRRQSANQNKPEVSH